MGRYSKKGSERRKKDREGYKEFYKKHVSNIKNNGERCAECGDRLQGHVSEIAHILPKNYFKSIATEDLNVLYMCGMYSKSQCHSKFDSSSNKIFKKMLVFRKVLTIFAQLKDMIEEKIPYKTYERYER